MTKAVRVCSDLTDVIRLMLYYWRKLGLNIWGPSPFLLPFYSLFSPPLLPPLPS